jgi:hypothetical protein
MDKAPASVTSGLGEKTVKQIGMRIAGNAEMMKIS